LARKAVLSGGKKDELVAAALKLFISNGYESTSVRSILDAVGGEVGMFYHYFKSKDEIFELAIELYLNRYVEQLDNLAKKDPSITGQFQAVMELVEETIMNYNKLGGQNLHWSTAIALHQRTLFAMLPTLEVMISNAIETNLAANPLNLRPQELASFLLCGISGILHQEPMARLTREEFAQKRETIKVLITHTIGIEKEELT
jgi:AcrR family transcriptional regulator